LLVGETVLPGFVEGVVDEDNGAAGVVQHGRGD